MHVSHRKQKPGRTEMQLTQATKESVTGSASADRPTAKLSVRTNRITVNRAGLAAYVLAL